ncbi:HDOD domain-containing protein [Uliginosibacterium sp. H1]|uniref:HDOD domain-containing protein n=1 Tax=Uliginosibacterium sp. H1 TaxID=3114757 RepID=UPI002E18AABD|nr:HDOD domain-containing protein [Uliginosibacterium sp. H1]
MINNALQNIDRYIAYFSATPLPVLRRTVRDLAALRQEEESVSGRRIASVVLQDPLMTLRVLLHLEANRGRSQNHDITTIERAIMMLGVTPFFEAFAELPTVEERLAAHPKALIGLLRVIARAKQSAHYARDWAVIRHDLDVDEVTVAALLHEAAEILLWCFAPAMMMKVTQVLNATQGLRSAVAQRSVLGAPVSEIQLALAKAWHLPELLVSLMDERQAENPRVRTVFLACNLSRHVANGWNDPALPDDFSEINQLLRLPPESFMQRLGVPPEYWPPLEKLEVAMTRTSWRDTNLFFRAEDDS